MWKLIKRRWKYVTARVAGRLEQSADPKIQLEQAIGEARDQHRRLKDQAANVIANHKQIELRLNRALSELERVNRNARQALMMAEEATRGGRRGRRGQGDVLHECGRAARGSPNHPGAGKSTV